MDRRKVLKSLGLGATALVATPTLVSLLQSCTSEPDFIPTFVDQEMGNTLRDIVDLIIPSDATSKGAKELRVHEFIDGYWSQILEPKNQAITKIGLTAMAVAFKNQFGSEITSANSEELDRFLSKYLMASKSQKNTYQKNLDQFYSAYAKDKAATPDVEAATYSILGSIRGMTIWGWKTTEEIGENYLAYEPIPGKQVGCLPLSEATAGKAYSL